MVDSAGLEAILNRLETGKRLSKQDLQTLVAAVRSQQVTIATGDRAVAIGGSAEGAVIVTGDRNIVIAGADAGAIGELIGSRPRAERLLLQAVKEEVTSRLKQSLHNQVLIQLGMEAQPAQVKRLWDGDIKIGNKPTEPIPEDWSILRALDEVQGKLLVLGKPGAGKTTILLELAQALVERAEQDANSPIPVLLNLSLCKPKDDGTRHTMRLRDVPISIWLVEELKSKYGLRKNIGNQWVEERRLLLLLDGLDELESARQERCVMAINTLLESDVRPLSLVVCSRWEEYGNYPAQLILQGAVCLQDLDDEQVRDYLLRVNRSELWAGLQQNGTLLTLVRTPFWLSILMLSEQELCFGNKHCSLGSTDEQVKRLLDAYVRRMLDRELPNRAYGSLKVPRIKQTRRWLVALANHLQKDRKTEFLIENLQPFHILDPELAGKYVANITTVVGLARLPTGLLWGDVLTIILDFLSRFLFKSSLFDLYIGKFDLYGEDTLNEISLKLKEINLYLGFLIGIIWSFKVDYDIKIVELLRWDIVQF